MIRIEEVSKSYKNRRVLHEVSFTAAQGRVTGFVGPNGAGKTTVLKIIAGLVSADAGTATVAGLPLAEIERPGATAGFFLSAEWLPGQSSAAAVMEYVCRTQNLPAWRGRESLRMVGLESVAQQKVRTFSLGMRQRLGIATATVDRPQVLVMDEPINGLDPDGIAWIRNFLDTSADRGATVLLSSHHMAELSEIADDIVMIGDGRILGQGTLDEFVEHASTVAYYVESPEPDVLLKAVTAYGISAKRHDQGLLVPHQDAAELASIAVRSGAGLTHLSRVSRSLEETYFEVLAQNSGLSVQK